MVMKTVMKNVGMNSFFLVRGSSKQDDFTYGPFVHSVSASPKHCSLLRLEGKAKESVDR